jgi:hypothetical protein
MTVGHNTQQPKAGGGNWVAILHSHKYQELQKKLEKKILIITCKASYITILTDSPMFTNFANQTIHI